PTEDRYLLTRQELLDRVQVLLRRRAAEEIVFGEKSAIVVDPNEEALKNEFSSVKRLMIPYHSISRIDEVEKEGQAKVIALSTSSAEEKSLPVPPFKSKE
ncbi:MAG: DUF1820 family protein, partial [Deltaproteobacteria bacterium]|nr:DUF1820 family protein [Deltaproteobacteria bacterium]